MTEQAAQGPGLRVTTYTDEIPAEKREEISYKGGFNLSPRHDSSIEPSPSSDLLVAVFSDSAGRGELPRGNAGPGPVRTASLGQSTNRSAQGQTRDSVLLLPDECLITCDKT